jgi:hypothetical protein
MYLAQTTTTVVGTPSETEAVIEIPAEEASPIAADTAAGEAQPITPESLTVEDGVIKIGDSEIPLSDLGISNSSIPAATNTNVNPALPADNVVEMTEGWARFAEPYYYFNPTPYEQGPFLLGKPLAVFFTLMLIISFSLLIRALLPRLKKRVIYRGIAYWLMFFGLTGYMFLYFRKDYVPYLSMRIWLTLTLLGFFAWLISQLIRYSKYQRSLPKQGN